MGEYRLLRFAYLPKLKHFNTGPFWAEEFKTLLDLHILSNLSPTLKYCSIVTPICGVHL